MRELTLGGAVAPGRVAAAATPGGTGAVRQALDLVRMTAPGATVWASDPTWANHIAILGAIGLAHRRYRHLDRESGGLDRAGMAEDLDAMQPGDVLLLHGCCHNPSGVDLAPADWSGFGRLCAERGVLPMVDLAYQGFAEGIEADVAGLRALAAEVPELLLCVSGSKTFGLYRERVGIVLAVAEGGAAARVAARLAGLNRQAYAFPPDHGARIVTTILGDPALRADWEAELATMRERLRDMRGALADALRAETRSDRFGFLAAQRGLFSLLGATPAEMERLRAEHGVYAVGDGRINVAGLTEESVPRAARAIAAVLG
jgi:aromatic-amino-acid transaminase